MENDSDKFVEDYFKQDGGDSVEFLYENHAPSKLSMGKDLIQFYREHPVEAAKELLGVHLIYTQRAMLNVMWNYPNVTEVLSRGMSKTFTLAVYAMLRLMLYPDIIIGVVSKTYRQAQDVFNYIKEINERALRADKFMFNDQLRKLTASTNATEALMKHGSKMFAVPVGKDGDGGRGKRCHILLVDESGIVPQLVIDRVVRAYLNVLPIEPLLWGKDQIATNQQVFCSSANFQWHWFFKEVCKYATLMKTSDLHYNLMLDFRDFEADPRSPFKLDWEKIKEAKRSMPRLDFMMEYMNYFLPEGFSFFSLKDLNEIKKGDEEHSIMVRADDGGDFMVVLDPAETAGGDNFACGVFKLVKETKTMVPVYLKKWNNGISMEEAAKTVRGLQFLFGAKFIVSDSKGGGAELIKQLTKSEGVSNHLGTGSFPQLSLFDKKRGRGLPIVVPVKFSSQLIEMMGWDLAYMIEQQRMKFPRYDTVSPNTNIKETSDLLVAMVKEISNVVTKASGQYTGFTTRTGKKDFFTIAMMAAHYANKFFDDELKSGKKRRSAGIVSIKANMGF